MAPFHEEFYLEEPVSQNFIRTLVQEVGQELKVLELKSQASVDEKLLAYAAFLNKVDSFLNDIPSEEGLYPAFRKEAFSFARDLDEIVAARIPLRVAMSKVGRGQAELRLRNYQQFVPEIIRAFRILERRYRGIVSAKETAREDGRVLDEEVLRMAAEITEATVATESVLRIEEDTMDPDALAIAQGDFPAQPVILISVPFEESTEDSSTVSYAGFIAPVTEGQN